MFNQIESLARDFASGSRDPQELQQGAAEHVAAMPPEQVSEHVQTAADNARANGQPDLAASLEQIVAQHGLNGPALKDAAVEFIKNNPQALAHFAPGFVQGILSKL